MSSGGVDGEFFTLRLSQDPQGGRVPTWGSMFLFQNFINNPDNTLVPLSFPYAVETILFQYDDVLSKWVYLSRSGIEQIAPTIQGEGTNVGDHPGNGGSVQALALPANTETAVFSDNGGFEKSQAMASSITMSSSRVLSSSVTSTRLPHWRPFVVTHRGMGLRPRRRPLLLWFQRGVVLSSRHR